MTKMYPLKLKPIYDQTIWADQRLTQLRGIQENGYGTCWEVSAHPYCQNEIVNGAFSGMDLMTLLNQHEKELLGEHPKEKMLRLAYLDAKDDLSIQVHPYNEYAQTHEHDLGKTESWYVLEAKPDATLVAGTLIEDKNIIHEAVRSNTLEQYLRHVEMKAGDFIFVPAGMLHALGGGILAIEVGTNSNTTYRFYDYGRKDANGKSRELHIDKSFDVVDLSLQTKKVETPIEEGSTQEKVLVDCPEFKVTLYDINGEWQFDTKGKDFHVLSFVHHGGEVVYDNAIIKAEYTENIVIPAACGKYTVRGQCRILKSEANSH